VTSFNQRYAHYRDLINQQLAQVASKKNPASFYEPVRYVLRTDGKRIRPILLLLSCEALGGKVDDSLNAAIAVELLHNFTLVHDDIMDQDDLRRGKETVHKKWDEATAILTGDGLVALSYLYLFRTNSVKIQHIGQIFSEGIIDICEGQVLDKEFESHDEISIDQYLKMIEKKTARLLILCTDLGGIIAGGTSEQIAALREYARQLGLAFQIQDDLLDMETTSGKTFGSDIQQKKKTLLYVHALNNADETGKQELLNIYKKEKVENQDIQSIRSIFQDAGTLDFAYQEVKARISEAERHLEKLPKNQAQEDLKHLLTFILNRKS
jgi:geranylgeranyl diphosphate synthase type II